MREIFARRLRELRTEVGLAQAELARQVGVERTQVCNWEKGRHFPAMETLPRLSQILHTTTDYLLGVSTTPSPTVAGVIPSVDPMLGAVRDSSKVLRRLLAMLEESDRHLTADVEAPVGRRLPLLGAVSAGKPEEAMDQAESWTVVPQNWLQPRDHGFVLRISGDSMAPTLEHGDLVVVKRQDNAQAGDVVVAVVDGAVLVKRLVRNSRGSLVLQPDAPSYESVPVGENTAINGKVVGLLRRLKKAGK